MMISGPLKLRQPGMPGPHNPAHTVWMSSAEDFTMAFRRARWRRFFERLTLRAQKLPLLQEITKHRPIRHRTDVGLRVVATKAIVGSVGRSADFDRDFTPLHSHTAQRWVSVNRAHYLGIPLPPVELIEVNNRFYVNDGHHRISVARWHGQTYLDAYVVRLEMHDETVGGSAVGGSAIGGAT
jgi:hypothetical protein